MSGSKSKKVKGGEWGNALFGHKEDEGFVVLWQCCNVLVQHLR
jgi:hypothetical protein